MKEYRKTYIPFIAWLLGFTGIALVAPGVAQNYFDISSADTLKIVMLVMIVSINLLFLMIYLGEYVYWINGGPDFERAKKAGSVKRKAYAMEHLRIFGKGSVIALIYLIFSVMFQFNVGMDLVVVIGMVLFSAIRTMKIKFEE